MAKIEITVSLDPEDRKLLKAVETAAKAITAKGGKSTPSKDDAADDEFDSVDGEPDTAEDGNGEDGGDEEDAGEDGEEKPDRDAVRSALRVYAQRHSQPEAIALMKKIGGTDKLSALKESKFAAVIAAAKKRK